MVDSYNICYFYKHFQHLTLTNLTVPNFLCFAFIILKKELNNIQQHYAVNFCIKLRGTATAHLISKNKFTKMKLFLLASFLYITALLYDCENLFWKTNYSIN